jgi:hypothetical protein
MTQGKSRMRQYRMSGSVRGAAREGGSYRDRLNETVSLVDRLLKTIRSPSTEAQDERNGS